MAAVHRLLGMTDSGKQIGLNWWLQPSQTYPESSVCPHTQKVFLRSKPNPSLFAQQSFFILHEVQSA